MNNKILIKVDAFALNESYDIFIPVNEVMWKVRAMIVKCICDIEHLKFDPSQEFLLINKKDGTIYDSNISIIDTDIRNSTELLLIKKS